jgi:hypothetical protein
MSVHLEELLKLPLLKSATLLTHPSTIDKNVSWVYLADTFPNIGDIRPWVGPGNLLVLIGHFINIGNYTLDDVVRLAYEMKFSGIVVYESDYIKNISVITIDTANEHNIPLFTISWKIAYNNLSKEILTCISANELSEKSHEDLLNSILFNNDANFEQLKSRPFRGDFPLNNENVILVSKFNHFFDYIKTNNYSEYEVSILKTYYKNILQQLLNSLQIKYMSVSKSDVIIVLLSESNSLKIQEKDFELKLNQLLNIKYKHSKVTVGIGSTYSHMKDYQKSYKEARYVIKAKQAGLVENKIIHYRDLDLYRLLFEIDNIELLKKLYPLHLKNVIAHDKSTYGTLMETLYCYLKNNRSINKAAHELFVHKNTVSYRIDKIKELTGLTLEEDQINFKLMSEISICKFISLK